MRQANSDTDLGGARRFTGCYVRMDNDIWEGVKGQKNARRRLV